jgi:hypothetical protein
MSRESCEARWSISSMQRHLMLDPIGEAKVDLGYNSLINLNVFNERINP